MKCPQRDGHLKKLFALILTFALAFVLIGCEQTDKTNPSLTNGSDTFISISEDGVTYKVTNEELYGYLKTQYGTSVLVSMIDKELLTENGFLAKVKEEEITAAIDEDVYGKDVEVSELDPEEKAELEKEFVEFATSKGMVGIKGHRSVGGFRASIYNALPMESVDALIAAMKEFEAKH